MGFIPDLTVTEWWHEVNLAYSASVPERFEAIMVGWLGNEITVKGTVSDENIEKLEWAYKHRRIDQAWLGEHECEICHKHWDRGEILIRSGTGMYVTPRMILHYITKHSYYPPLEFIKAVENMNTK